MPRDMTSEPDQSGIDQTQRRRDWRNAEEPWPIWAALMVYLNIVVIAGMGWGLPGIVTVAVPAALLMLVVLVLIVFG